MGSVRLVAYCLNGFDVDFRNGLGVAESIDGLLVSAPTLDRVAGDGVAVVVEFVFVAFRAAANAAVGAALRCTCGLAKGLVDECWGWVAIWVISLLLYIAACGSGC